MICGLIIDLKQFGLGDYDLIDPLLMWRVECFRSQFEEEYFDWLLAPPGQPEKGQPFDLLKMISEMLVLVLSRKAELSLRRKIARYQNEEPQGTARSLAAKNLKHLSLYLFICLSHRKARYHRGCSQQSQTKYIPTVEVTVIASFSPFQHFSGI